MKVSNAAKQRSLLTPNQQQTLDMALLGMAINEPKDVNVKTAIATARQELADSLLLKRVDVIDGILDGIQVARTMSDGGNMIRGWCEIAKILGHYAPEVRTVNLNINQQRLISKFEAMSDEELLAIHERGHLIEHNDGETPA